MLEITVYTSQPITPNPGSDESTVKGPFENVFEIDVGENCYLEDKKTMNVQWCTTYTQEMIEISNTLCQHYMLPDDALDQKQLEFFFKNGLYHQVFYHEVIQEGLQIFADTLEKIRNNPQSVDTLNFLEQPYVTTYTLLVQSLMLASKMMNDSPFNNKAWAAVSQLHLLDINDMERDHLAYIGLWKHSEEEVMEDGPTTALLQLSVPPALPRIQPQGIFQNQNDHKKTAGPSQPKN